MSDQRWSGLHKLPVNDRRNYIERFSEIKLDNVPLTEIEMAENLIENCIGTLPMPLGLCPHFIINSRQYLIPMAVEEASVVAAANGAAKTIASSGGFKILRECKTVHLGQVLMDSFESINDAIEICCSKKLSIIETANKFCAGMVSRGGGVIDFFITKLSLSTESLSINFKIDTREAMGANCINSVLEGLSPFLEELMKGRVVSKILSNHCPDRSTKVNQ